MSWKKRNKSRKTDRRLIKSKKTTIDGVEMKSRLEGAMMLLLKSSGLDFSYESQSFIISDAFNFDNISFERKANGKGDMIDRGGKKVQNISYTPDFVIPHFEVTYIIECKGLRTESFNMRYKLFKKHITDNNLNYKLYMPHTQKECKVVMDLILTDISNTKK